MNDGLQSRQDVKNGRMLVLTSIGKKKLLGFTVTRPTLISIPDPTKFFRFFPKKKHASIGKRSSYPSTMTVTDIFHDIHLPVDKTSIVTARGSAVVSGPAVSKKINSK
jgi:hypothetical protein